MVNKLWLVDYGATVIEVLTVGTSNHQPILLSTNNTLNHNTVKQRLFRFEAKRSLEEDSEQTIREAWQRQISAPNCWAKIHSKLVVCSGVLRRWSAKKAQLTKQELEDKITNLNQL